MAGVRTYSTTASDNINVGGVSIAEGMARASVNNGMRAQIADVAKLLLDLSGGIVTTGTDGSYAVTLATGPMAYTDNLLFLCEINHTSPGPSTINVNGMGNKAFGKLVGGVAASFEPGDAPAGHKAICLYSSSDDAVLLLNQAAASITGEARDFLDDPSSANLAALMTDELGSPGQVMFSGVMDVDPLLAANSDARLATQKATKSFVAEAFDAVMDPDPTLTTDSDDLVATQKATKAYVDGAVVGIQWAAGGTVACATTANITMFGEQTIDGVLTAGSRVLVKNQTAPAENGIYLSNGGVWARAADANSGAEMVSLGVFVDGGGQIGSQWRCTSTTPPTLGTTPIAFTKIGTTTVYSAGAGLQLVGTTFSVADNELLALGGTTAAANQIPYYTGTTTASTSPFTATGRAVVGAASTDAVKTAIGVGTGDSPQFLSVNLGHASDTTLSRVSAGQIAIEGNVVYRAGGTDVALADGGTGASTAAAARANLGLDTGNTPWFTALEIGHVSDTTLSRISAGQLAIEGSVIYRANGTDVAVIDGGTGASTAAGARTNLGIDSSDIVQFGALELGHPTDTTITRPAPGVIAVEGDVVAMRSTNNGFLETQSIIKTVAGSSAVALALVNNSSSAGTETILDLAPNNNGIGARSVQIAAEAVSPSVTRLLLRVSNAAAPADAITVEATRTVRFNGYGEGMLTTDSGGLITATPLQTGNYTPVTSDHLNISSTSPNNCYYQRVADSVTVWGSLSVDAVTEGATCHLDMSLPIASDFAAATQLRGFFGANAFPGAGASVMTADTVANRAEVSFIAAAAGSTAYSFQFSYRIV